MPSNQVRVFRADAILQPEAEGADAMAVAGDRVIAVGSAAQLRRRYDGAQWVDLAGATIVPGFIDAHMHLASMADNLLYLDLSDLPGADVRDVLGKVAAARDERPAGTWIRGAAYDDSALAGGPLDRRMLDAVAPDHPVLITHIAMHWGIANSAALRAGGIDEATPPPPGGQFGRDADGRLNGVIYEQALFDFAWPGSSRLGRTIAPAPSQAERLSALGEAVTRLHAAGMTSIGEALVGPDEFRLLEDGYEAGKLTLRVNMLISAEHYQAMKFAMMEYRPGDNWLRVGGIKTFTDGAIGGRTCLLEEPLEAPDAIPIQTRTPDELAEVVALAHHEGLAPCIHANGDRAIAIALDVLADARRRYGPPAVRSRIEHCTVVTHDLVARMRELDVCAVPFATYVDYYGQRLRNWYGDRVSRMFAHRWFLDAGVPVAGASDYPCGPYSPLLGMQSCVTRRGRDGAVIGPDQRISAAEALRVYTSLAATVSGEQDLKGSLRPGLLADFAVLSDNPLTADPAALSKIAVRQTYVAGEIAWAAEGFR